MKKVLTTMMMLAMTMAVMAVPAKRGQWKAIQLADGTEVHATLVGDEHGHFWKGEDGKAYIEQDDVWVAVDAQQVVEKAKARRAKVNARRVQRRTFGHPTTITGKKKGIIILVNYSDKSFNSSNNNALYQKIANQENFKEGSFKGSMADYFKAQSRGKFELDFDVVGPVKVSQKASYYGSNDSQGNDKYPGKMIIEAVNLAKQQISDWTQYDWDGDGYVDQVYVVYAGMGEADGGASTTIWPHAYDLRSAQAYGDGSGPVEVSTGLYVNSYACGSELNGTGSVAGIGTMCHEFSHCLGYPDFYDTDYSGGQGMCTWDLMDSGSYNGDGYQPAGYTSYERWFAGWEEPIVLEDEDVTVENLKSLQSGGSGYIIYNKAHRDEFFLLENRQFDGWDASLDAAGLLIIHVDYSASVWESNTPNDNPSRQRMTWIPAGKTYKYQIYDGNKYYEVSEQDVFPYKTTKSFNKDFGTLAKLYNKNSDKSYYLSSSVENITQNNDGTISFKYVANISGGESGGESGGDVDGDGEYEKVTSASQIVAGKKYVLVNADNSKGNGVFSSTYLSSVNVVIDGSTASGDNLSPLTLGGSDGAYSLKTADGKYLTTTGAKKMSTSSSESKVWLISSTSDGYVVKTKSYGTVQYNATSPRFVNYTSSQKPAVLYVMKESTTTAIQTVTTTATAAPKTGIYTLDGRYMGNDYTVLPRGLYIINGKKVVK